MGLHVYSTLAKQEIVNYFGFIDDTACSELKTMASSLDLDCLRFIYFAGDTFFNYEQIKHILGVEIPILHKKKMTQETQEAINIIEQAAKQACTKAFVYYVWFYAD